VSAAWIRSSPICPDTLTCCSTRRTPWLFAKQKSRPLVGVGSYLLAAVLGY
jgi:hypothetical protein